MNSIRKDQIRTLLKGIETGDAAAAAVVNPEKYIQHNPQTHEGSEGLAVLFKRLSKSSPRVNLVRVFEDGDFVFAHTEYEFSSSKIGFEVFRYEDDMDRPRVPPIRRRVSSGQYDSGRGPKLPDLGLTVFDITRRPSLHGRTLVEYSVGLGPHQPPIRIKAMRISV